jgi:putative Ca2+/H+ antiporter (TMEM165/GDT1 family)
MLDPPFAVISIILIVAVLLIIAIRILRLANRNGETTAKVDSDHGTRPTTTRSARSLVFSVFLLFFVLYIVGSFVIFGSIPGEVWTSSIGGGIMSSLTGLVMFSVVLNVCFLAIAYWVWEDDERLKRLEKAAKGAGA